MSVGVVIVTHYHLGAEFLQALRLIVPGAPGFLAVGIEPTQSVEEMRGAISQALSKAEQGQGVLVLTDMFGGTPSIHDCIQIAFDKSEARAAGEPDKREIGDAQASRFAREEREHDDRHGFCQLFDRRGDEPRHQTHGIGTCTRGRQDLLEHEREKRCTDGAVAEHHQDAAQGQRHAACDRPAFQENDQEEDQQTETGPEGKHVQTPHSR